MTNDELVKELSRVMQNVINNHIQLTEELGLKVLSKDSQSWISGIRNAQKICRNYRDYLEMS